MTYNSEGESERYKDRPIWYSTTGTSYKWFKGMGPVLTLLEMGRTVELIQLNRSPWRHESRAEQRREHE